MNNESYLKKGDEKKPKFEKTKPEFVLELEFMDVLQNLGYSLNKNVKNVKTLKENLREKLEKLNNFKLSKTEFDRILVDLEGVNELEAFDKLRSKHLLERDDSSKIYYKLIDFDNLENNSFEVVNQLEVQGRYRNRYDVTILINGLPLAQVELKKSGVDIKDGFEQIRRYKSNSYKGLLRYIQVFVISNEDITKYFANTLGDLNYKFSFFWTDEYNQPYLNLIDFTKSFLQRDHLMEMMNNNMIHNKTEKKIIILRPYQYYASQKVIDKVINTKVEDIDQNDPRFNGYIWHSTGSGKTLTSFKVSQTLSKNKEIKKVIFLVDRKDLDLQTAEEFNKLKEGSVDNTESTKVLMKQLQDDNNNLILTTIQKMSNAIKRYNSKLKHLKNERVVFVVDECHRSQFGDMHKIIRKYFRKSQFIGFTGTPIFDINANDPAFTTKNIFGECIHSYMLVDAIADGNVLPFQVEYINTFKLNKNIDDVKVKNINKDEAFKSEERISMIANDILKNHHIKTYNKNHNSILAVDSVESAIKYSKAFKKLQDNNSKYSDIVIATIYSYDDNYEFKDIHPRESLDELISDYNRIFNTSFSTENLNAYRHSVSKNMKNGEIDILIVVDMFLTGFDAKRLSVLYLDKNLKYHNLLQAFSRTNRVYNQGKMAGIITSYRNIQKDVDDAIKLFNNSDNIDGVFVKSLDEYIEDFKEKLSELKDVLPEANADHLDNIKDEDKQLEFVRYFRELLKIKKVMETFVDFDFNDASLGINENEFSKYQSFYHELYRKSQSNSSNAASILKDVDFHIDLINISEINYKYIMKILKDDKTDKKNRIIRALQQSNDNELYYKKDLILKFLEEQEEGKKDIGVNSFNEFVEKQRRLEFKAFSKKTGLSVNQLEEELLAVSYDPNEEWSRFNSSSKVRNYLAANGKKAGILEIRRITNQLDEFLKESYMKYMI